MSTPNVLIVGGGLTACTLAHRLAEEGVPPRCSSASTSRAG
jgi:glycine/D-amino acid oxidase-like deaminating enzyme